LNTPLTTTGCLPTLEHSCRRRRWIFFEQTYRAMRTVRDLDAQSRCLEFVRGQSRNRKWPTHLGSTVQLVINDSKLVKRLVTLAGLLLGVSIFTACSRKPA